MTLTVVIEHNLYSVNSQCLINIVHKTFQDFILQFITIPINKKNNNILTTYISTSIITLMSIFINNLNYIKYSKLQLEFIYHLNCIKIAKNSQNSQPIQFSIIIIRCFKNENNEFTFPIVSARTVNFICTNFINSYTCIYV